MSYDPDKSLALECPECAGTVSQTLGWLATHTELVCPQCNARFEIRIQDPKATPIPNSAKARCFYSKVAGVTFQNDDGVPRQRIIARCRVGERLLLRHETQNPASSTAVGVFRENGEKLGYLNARLGGDLCSDLDRGEVIPCCISDLTGGGQRTRGVNIYLGAWEDPRAREGLAETENLGVSSGIIAILTLIALVAAIAYILSRR